MESVTVYDSWRNGHFERYYLNSEGKKVILEQSENTEPPFVKIQFVSMERERAGAVGGVAESHR